MSTTDSTDGYGEGGYGAGPYGDPVDRGWQYYGGSYHGETVAVDPDRKPPTGVQWLINSTIADGHTGSAPSPVPGETDSYQFLFVPDRIYPRSRNVRDEYLDRWREVKALLDRAGEFELYESIDEERLFKTIGIGPPPIVRIEPADGVRSAEGEWGLLEAGETSTPTPETAGRIELEVLHLAPLRAYDNRSAVRDALEVSGL